MGNSKQEELHRNIIYTLVFGITWGFLEILLGSMLYNFSLIFKGIIISSITVLILVSVKSFILYKSSLIFVGIIAALLRGAASGFIITNAVFAIIIEAVIAELIFSVWSYKNITAVISGSLIVLYSYIHSLIFHGSLPAAYIKYLYRTTVESLISIEISDTVLTAVLIVYGVIIILIGATVGRLSWLFKEHIFIPAVYKIEKYIA
jgi:hypothetical protein